MAPELVRELLALSLVGFSPVLLLAAAVGALTLLVKLRGPARPDGRDRRSDLTSPDAQRVLRRMRRNKDACVLLAAADRDAFSRLGGHPALPDGVSWPEGPDGQLRFFCQIDLAEARANGAPEWLPKSGRLYAFHGEDYGAPDQVRILFASAEAELAARHPRDASAWPYDERPIAFVKRDSLPSLDWLGEDTAASSLDMEDLERLVELSDLDWTGPLHKLGGYPDEIQNGQMAVACERARNGSSEDRTLAARAFRNWRLLLQIDTDRDLGASFGDGGRLYVFVHRKDARQTRFDRTVTVYQT